jgi:uncharacterized protein (DUF2267 family)
MPQLTEHALEERRRHRSEAHRAGTWGRFLNQLCDETGYEKRFASEATASVLGALEQRLRMVESDHLEAQLPAKLRELLDAKRGERRLKPRQVHSAEMITMVSEDLDRTPQEAEVVVRDVLCQVRGQISEPEARRVERILPMDMRTLWTPLA